MGRFVCGWVRPVGMNGIPLVSARFARRSLRLIEVEENADEVPGAAAGKPVLELLVGVELEAVPYDTVGGGGGSIFPEGFSALCIISRAELN